VDDFEFQSAGLFSSLAPPAAGGSFHGPLSQHRRKAAIAVSRSGAFPWLERRLKCPRCGSRREAVMFQPPLRATPFPKFNLNELPISLTPPCDDVLLGGAAEGVNVMLGLNRNTVLGIAAVVAAVIAISAYTYVSQEPTPTQQVK
jgi:hypothetical protein